MNLAKLHLLLICLLLLGGSTAEAGVIPSLDSGDFRAIASDSTVEELPAIEIPSQPQEGLLTVTVVPVLQVAINGERVSIPNLAVTESLRVVDFQLPDDPFFESLPEPA